ncbi:hypothetical protein [Nostoc sp.]|uniref:hypothetical protein n=1 Tax=Nostoc sp. TaxID=1180 RepID=UPI002FF52DCC
MPVKGVKGDRTCYSEYLKCDRFSASVKKMDAYYSKQRCEKMKKFSGKLVASLFVVPLTVFSFSLKSNAQIFDPETLTTLQICNTIMNLQDADPDNYELRIGRRECDVRAYYVQLCTASGYDFAACWDENYTQAVDVSTEELEEIIANNQ